MFTHLMENLSDKNASVGIVGLGYVGLPLACELASKYKVLGFDINKKRVSELCEKIDRTNEIRDERKLSQENLSFSYNPTDLKNCEILIVAVPTPIDTFKNPELTILLSATDTVANNLKKGAIVVYESTVYPGVTDELCTKKIENISGLKVNEGFYVGYSPERVNPGDEKHTIDKIVKVVAGSTPEVASFLGDFYKKVITAGVHIAPNIMTAEAAKAIENTQRDVNIALINELAILFDRVGIDTQEVLQAAGTKWNFLNFRPGLVGGHCIGVDPYYLTHLASKVGIHTECITAGRRINDRMGRFVSSKTLKLLLQHRSTPANELKVALLGVTFKENVPDTRNSKSLDIVKELEEFGVQTYMVDPMADPISFEQEYQKKITPISELPTCDAIIIAVGHRQFEEIKPKDLKQMTKSPHIVVDIKGIIDQQEANAENLKIWRL